MSSSARFRSVAGAVAWRSLHNFLTTPALLLPALIFPLFFFSAFAGSLSRIDQAPGFDYSQGYTAFIFAFVLLQASAFGGVFTGFGIARDFETGFGRRLLLASGPTSQIAARLVDVDPDTGNETLVARTLYRPTPNATKATRQVFQLHPNGYLFAAGHVAKLELLPSDAPYGRVSNGQMAIDVSNLDLRLPVLESPGTPHVVTQPAPKFVPPAYEPIGELGPNEIDSDGDGVADSKDKCINRPGPASNQGCPLPRNAACATVLRGTSGKDKLKGTALGEKLVGRAGSDAIKGKGGDDCLVGNGGRDRLSGGDGKDRIRAGAGSDRINAADGKRDIVNCGSGHDRVTADKADRLRKCERKLVLR